MNLNWCRLLDEFVRWFCWLKEGKEGVVQKKRGRCQRPNTWQ